MQSQYVMAVLTALSLIKFLAYVEIYCPVRLTETEELYKESSVLFN